MRFLVLIPALLISFAAYAAPQQEVGIDEIQQILAEKGIGGHLDKIRQTVSERSTELVDTAFGFLGVPYHRGGNSAKTGFDCSGFVRAIYNQTIGFALPRRAVEQAAATEPVARADLKPGDLVFFNTMRRAFSHVGMYVGGGKFIHSPRTGSTVRVDDLNGSYWQRRFDGARRVQAMESDAVIGE